MCINSSLLHLPLCPNLCSFSCLAILRAAISPTCNSRERRGRWSVARAWALCFEALQPHGAPLLVVSALASICAKAALQARKGQQACYPSLYQYLTLFCASIGAFQDFLGASQPYTHIMHMYIKANRHLYSGASRIHCGPGCCCISAGQFSSANSPGRILPQ